MYSEIGFIFNPALNLNNSNNTKNIYGKSIRLMSSGGTIEDGILIYKNPTSHGTEGIKNYLVDSIYREDNDSDPYISLIKYFNRAKFKSLKLRAADFAYLKDLGVYPINRLWILRRFPENCIVSNNLLDNGNIEPISTVIGWMKDREDSPLATLSFSEVWIDHNKMLDQVIKDVLADNFGGKLSSFMSVPGWSQGILFGMLNAAGLSQDFGAGDFNAMDVPTGNPNVLRTAKIRETDSQGLRTSLSFNLDTCYEQKYINGIDPGLAMLDIITNLLKMGTSDQKFILSRSKELTRMIEMLNNHNNNVDAWIKWILDLIDIFLNGVSNYFLKLRNPEPTVSGSTEGSTVENNDNSDTAPEPLVPIPSAESLTQVSSVVKNLGKSILAGTVMKFRWPIKGSLALMSGINSTPWHLTIGNPYSPIINIGNIVVGDIEIKLSNDLGFNDMPLRIDVNIPITLGRPLGKQEIERMFNGGYKRVYSSSQINRLNDSEQQPSSNITSSGIPAPENVLNRIDSGEISSVNGRLVSTNNGPI